MEYGFDTKWKFKNLLDIKSKFKDLIVYSLTDRLYL